MRSELLGELEELHAKSQGSPLDRHMALLHLRNMLPEIIAAIRERAPPG